MVAISLEKAEQTVIAVVKKICKKLKIEANIDNEFCPGKFIKSQVLLTFISEIAEELHVKIANKHYIFSNGKDEQLSIHETAEKILKVAENVK
jgi:hypothetical protein